MNDLRTAAQQALEASEETHWKPALGNEHVVEFIERFFAIAIAAEREACAKVCDAFESEADPDAGFVLAAAIRARGNA